MIISESHKFIFVHVPKTGGVSCMKALRRFETKWEGRLPSKHAALKEFLDKNPQCASYYSFGFVRNPWGRLASFYFYLRDVKSHNHPLIKTVRDFSEFVQRLDEPWLAKRHAIRPQFEIIEGANFIGRYENLHEDFATVCKHLKIRCKLPHLNKTKHAHYREYYTPQTRDIVAEKYAEDIKRFNYDF